MDHEEIARVTKELDEILENASRLELPKQVDFQKEEIREIKEIETAPSRHLEEQEDLDDVLEYVETEVAGEPEVPEVKVLEPETSEKKVKNGNRKSLFKPKDALVASFVVPFFIMVLIFAVKQIYPFGEESFLRTDMYHQYAPFFSEFQYKLTHGGSLLYSWDVGMGVNFSALYAYYLASPLNWLLILCPKGLIIEFMTYSIAFKTGLAGLSFTYYIRKHSNTEDFGAAFFGIFYALSGYMAAYSWNIMWLDCILLFPLVMLGLERLVHERKGLLYAVTLGCCILSNYYISIMICLFIVLYFVARFILERKIYDKDCYLMCGQFCFYSLLAGGLAAVVLLPEIFALQATASGEFSFPKTVTSYFSIFDMIARHMGNVETEIGLDHWPNIYCGVAVYLLFLLYLVCKKISVREKVVYCGLLLMFYASFSVNILNFIWHGFHYPNSLPCRQSFIYIAMILLMCYQAYTHLEDIPWKHVVLAWLGSVCFVLIAEKTVTQDHFQFWVYYVAILLLALYTGMIYLYRVKHVSVNVLLLATLGIVILESAVNMAVTSVTTTSRTAYVRDNQEVADLVAALNPNTTFYRVEKVDRKTKNDGAWMNFPSVSLFSSTANADLSTFFKKLGCESSTNAYSITGSTPMVDSLFSVRYALYDQSQSDRPELTLIQSEGDTFLYRNPDVLPLGFMVPSDLEENWQIGLGNPARVQNDLSQVMGADPVLLQTWGEMRGNRVTFTPEKTGMYYAYVTNSRIEKVTVEVGQRSQKFDNLNRGYMIDLGLCEAGELVTMTGDRSEDELMVEIYQFSYEGLHSLYQKLNERPLTLTSWTDTTIEGNVDAKANETLFTSIPYDEGWSVYVDGVLCTSKKMVDTFLAVDLLAGSHIVKFSYEPQGLRMGAVISGVSLLILVMVILLGRFMKTTREMKTLDKAWDAAGKKVLKDTEDMDGKASSNK